jgi:para-aminobenzoate synthetase component 1
VTWRTARRKLATYMEEITFENWLAWRNQGHARLPASYVRAGECLPDAWTPFSESRVTVLLESARAGRYSFYCDQPKRLIIGEETRAEIRSTDGTDTIETVHGPPLTVLKTILARVSGPKLRHWPAMTGGLIGVLGYDLVRTWERLPTTARRDLGLPLYAMIEPEVLFIHDAQEAALGVIAWCELASAESDLSAQFERCRNQARLAYDRWTASKTSARPPGPTGSARAQAPAPSFGPGGFESAVLRVKEYIAAGDTYQVNLSLRKSQPTGLRAEQIYDSVRRVNPSPYMGLLRLPQFALICGSPELLVKLEDGLVSSRPIAGTRRRGDGPTQDSELSAELLANDKERAEHLMLVDLIRNDIGRVAEFASVRVPEFMVVERYSHVMHIVSQVEGRIAQGKTWADVLQSMFPGGTITGCPKIRTMEIIEELEPVGRGYYTGAMGWISYSGEMEMNIVIRSMLLRDGVAHVQAGAGIVADSQPERELDEASRKAQALWDALKQATHHHG